MTLAIDKRSGRPIGQVIDHTPQVSLDRDPSARPLLLILGREGWTTVAADSVRLEEVDDD